jgi:hypothetical protein
MYKYKKVSDDLTLQIQNGRQPVGYSSQTVDELKLNLDLQAGDKLLLRY